MSSVPVLGNFLGISEGVHLRLQPDLHDLHRTHNSDSFRNTGAQTSCLMSKDRKFIRRMSRGKKVKRTDENVTDGRLPGCLVCQEILVCLEAGEPNRHFGHDTRKDGTETLVKRQRRLSSDDLGSCSDEASWFRLSS